MRQGRDHFSFAVRPSKLLIGETLLKCISTCLRRKAALARACLKAIPGKVRSGFPSGIA